MSYQSILLVAAIFAREERICFFAIIIALAGIVQLWSGLKIVEARAIVVDYYKYNLSSKYNDEGGYIKDKDDTPIKVDTYVHNVKVRKKINDIEIDYEQKFLFGCIFGKNWRKTRIKMDLVIPFSFFVIWVYFILHILYTQL